MLGPGAPKYSSRSASWIGLLHVGLMLLTAPPASLALRGASLPSPSHTLSASLPTASLPTAPLPSASFCVGVAATQPGLVPAATVAPAALAAGVAAAAAAVALAVVAWLGARLARKARSSLARVKVRVRVSLTLV